MSELIILQDGTHDRQSGVYEHYNGKADWLAKEIDRMADKGYRLQQRLPDVGLTIFEPTNPAPRKSED